MIVSCRGNVYTWSSVHRQEHTEDWTVLASQHSSCTGPAAVCKITVVVVVAADVGEADVVVEQTHFAECSRCLEEQCRKTCLSYLKQPVFASLALAITHLTKAETDLPFKSNYRR